jgi:hypothetical protein
MVFIEEPRQIKIYFIQMKTKAKHLSYACKKKAKELFLILFLTYPTLAERRLGESIMQVNPIE